MIQGVNVRLRPFNLTDSVHIAELKKDVEGLRAFAGSPFPSNAAGEEEWISNMYHKGINENIYLAVEEIKSGTFGGYCIARNINYINRNAEVGIIFSAGIRGRGYFKEVSYLFYDYLFAQLNLHKLYSYVIGGNPVLKSDLEIGFAEEGLIREHLWQNGKYINLTFVSLYENVFYRIWNKGLGHFQGRS